MAETFKINLSADKLYLVDRILRPRGRKKNRGARLTSSKRAILGKIFAFSHTKDEDAVCRVCYDQLQADYDLSRSTVADSLRTLKEQNLIEEVDRDRFGSSYRYIGKTSAGGYYPVPQYLYTLDVFVNGTEQRLKKSQVQLLAYLMYRCNKGAYETSARRLAGELDLSEPTIKRGLKVLFHARLIYRPAESKGKNGHKLSAYLVNKDLYDVVRKAKKKAGKPRQADENKAFVPKAVQDADARADRDRFYAQRRQAAHERLDKFLLTVPDIVNLNRAISANGAKVVREELGLGQSNAARIKQANLQRDRALLLERCGVREEQFDIKYYFHCKKCSDTGFRESGAACDCYRRE